MKSWWPKRAKAANDERLAAVESAASGVERVIGAPVVATGAASTGGPMTRSTMTNSSSSVG